MAARRPPRGPCGGAGVRPRAWTDAYGAAFTMAVEHDDRLGPKEKECLLVLAHGLTTGLVTSGDALRRMERYLGAGETETALDELVAWLDAKGVVASLHSPHFGGWD